MVCGKGASTSTLSEKLMDQGPIRGNQNHADYCKFLLDGFREKAEEHLTPDRVMKLLENLNEKEKDIMIGFLKQLQKVVSEEKRDIITAAVKQKDKDERDAKVKKQSNCADENAGTRNRSTSTMSCKANTGSSKRRTSQPESNIIELQIL